MKQVINLPRIAVKNWKSPAPENCVWISISEPDCLDSIVSNEILDKLPVLRLSFWDLTSPIVFHGETLFPPSEAYAKSIVDFLVTNKGKNVIVNCAAGVSRSGAVAQFCADYMDHEWMEEGKKNAVPNHVLYNLMRDYYNSFSWEEKHGPVKLLTAAEIALTKTNK